MREVLIVDQTINTISTNISTLAIDSFKHKEASLVAHLGGLVLDPRYHQKSHIPGS